MSRDYKSRANPQAKRRRQVPGPVWFVCGLLVGLFLSGLAWLKMPGVSDTSLPTGNADSAVNSGPPSVAEKSAPPKPRFDFYTILPEMEVVVPEPLPPDRSVTVEETTTNGGAQDRYMLQMGSFRKYSDADRLKASLALVGIQAEIQRVKIDSGDIFHRVRSGPYGVEKVNQLNAKLKANSISSLVIKLK
ncbi:MAG: SPOR domain-containing protein [Gammaproteobacteria bacterium]|nr:SPOR domain-containing protein [Gammaproteobacteria bacterium]